MNSATNSETYEPLDHFPVVRTADPVEARELMRQRFGIELTTFDAAGFFVRANRARLLDLWILFWASASPSRLLIPDCVSAHAHLPLRGHCSLETDTHRYDFAQGDAFVCTPGRTAQLDFGAGYEELVFGVPTAMLARTMTRLAGVPLRAPVWFEPAIASDEPRFVGFRDLLMLLARRLDPAFSVWPQAMLGQLEQACVSSLLYCSRHDLRHLLDRRTDDDPACVRTAENYIEAHGGIDITVEDLARAADVSVSTLSRAFHRSRGCSPSAFLKRMRLSRARKLLESGAVSTVIGVALRCGFANPSRFAQDYREAFGESPTDTLRGSRPSPPAPDTQEH